MYVYAHVYVVLIVASIIVPVALSASSSCYSLQSTSGGKEEASAEPQTPDY